MNEQESNSIHKEFELERIILFSDAVFAIAITLLIIEIKFPEFPVNYKGIPPLLEILRPTILQFTSFLVSFFFIGLSWSRHLKMFRYLKGYDDRVIFLNLLSLLFIVTFPFSASGAIRLNDVFVLPFLIYLANIMLVMITNFLLAHHIFKKRAHLSMPGFEAEKKYIYLQARYSALAMIASFVIITTTAVISDRPVFFKYSIFSLFIFLFLARRASKKHRPKNLVKKS